MSVIKSATYTRLHHFLVALRRQIDGRDDAVLPLCAVFKHDEQAAGQDAPPPTPLPAAQHRRFSVEQVPRKATVAMQTPPPQLDERPAKTNRCSQPAAADKATRTHNQPTPERANLHTTPRHTHARTHHEQTHTHENPRTISTHPHMRTHTRTRCAAQPTAVQPTSRVSTASASTAARLVSPLPPCCCHDETLATHPCCPMASYRRSHCHPHWQWHC